LFCQDTSVGTIWTPSGEYEPRAEPAAADPARPDLDEPSLATEHATEITAEELEALRAVHDQLRATPAADVVANHVIQLFQLAVIYLGLGTPPDEAGRSPRPDLAQAGFVIDTMAMVVDGMGERFGDHEQTLRDALAQLQLAYVQIAEQQPDR
jgi:hypothetical protein